MRHAGVQRLYFHPFMISRLQNIFLQGFAFLGLTLIVLPSFAQNPLQATLEGWEDGVQRAIGDRYHAYGGIYYDRGLFRPLTPDMDGEYILDEATAGFTLVEDSRFYSSRYGFRFYAASIDKSRFITYGYFRAAVPVKGKHTLRVEGVQQEDLRGRRSFINLGYEYQITGKHRFGGAVSGAAYKPDIDLSLHYQYGSKKSGLARIQYTMLDVANNLIFNTLGVDPVLEDTTRSYSSSPGMFSMRLFSPKWNNIRAELVGGHQTQAQALVQSQAAPDTSFYWDDSASYFGALIEYYVSPVVTIGLSHRYTSNDIVRGSPENSAFSSDYTSEQWSRRTGVFAVGVHKEFQADFWYTFSKSKDAQAGTDYDQANIQEDMDYRRDESLLEVRLRRMPFDSGVLAGIDLRFHHLSENEDAEIIDGYRKFTHLENGQRSTITLGYQFRQDSYFEFGMSYDFDGDKKDQRFDGAFLRLMILW